MNVKQKATTIRVSVKTRDRIAALARKAGEPMTAIIEQAIRELEKKHRWQHVAEQMERTRKEDPRAWADYLAESELVQGPPSRHPRIAPEWEGLITFPEERDEGDPRRDLAR
ncbi:ribbon-helix-helix protein, CopG family [Nonomuraea sp. NPDC049141]|uniref:ribbon-helix-helix protein, CopG family n=1 Tax=unclassified Nonomuraea TaxID=2593643 RepID=UPI0033FD69DE